MIVEKILDAIYALEEKNVMGENMVVAMSPIIYRLLENEVTSQVNIKPSAKAYILGIEIYKYHPYNEIVVYHKENASYIKDLLIRVKL